jgi:hypothetical protein
MEDLLLEATRLLLLSILIMVLASIFKKIDSITLEEGGPIDLFDLFIKIAGVITSFLAPLGSLVVFLMFTLLATSPDTPETVAIKALGIVVCTIISTIVGFSIVGKCDKKVYVKFSVIFYITSSLSLYLVYLLQQITQAL